MAGASVAARNLGHPRVDSEHLPLALAQADGAIAFVLARHGAKAYALREAVQAAGPQGAGMAAGTDRRALLAALAENFPSPANRAPRSTSRTRRTGPTRRTRARQRGLVQRYQQRTGRIVVHRTALAALIGQLPPPAPPTALSALTSPATRPARNIHR